MDFLNCLFGRFYKEPSMYTHGILLFMDNEIKREGNCMIRSTQWAYWIRMMGKLWYNRENYIQVL